MIIQVYFQLKSWVNFLRNKSDVRIVSLQKKDIKCWIINDGLVPENPLPCPVSVCDTAKFQLHVQVKSIIKGPDSLEF